MSSDSKEMKRQARMFQADAVKDLKLGSPDGSPGKMVLGIAKIALGKLMNVAGNAKAAQDHAKGER